MSAAVLLILLLFGCGGEPSGESATGASKASAGGAVVSLEPRVGATVNSADGVPIVYDVHGSGSPALVFVHGWSCDREFWRDQIAIFAEQHTVVTLDLAGHGASGTGRSDWSVLGLGSDVEAVVRELGLDRAILIGHSMGAPVALEAARRMPKSIEAVVAVDALHNADFVPSEAELTAFNQLIDILGTDYAEGVGLMFHGMLPDNAAPELSEWIVSRAQGTAPEGAIELMKDFLPLDLPALMSSVEVPVRAVNAAPIPGRSYGTQIEANRQYCDFDAVLVEGVGHFLQLERPAEFNSALAGVLDELTAR